jgi:hypothetical protein
MNHLSIKKLQKEWNFAELQELINSGQAWKMEGSVGRQAMQALEVGACMLPKKAKYDYYGNRVPSRDELKPGTKGTYLNAKNYWSKVVEYGFAE